MNKLKKIRNRIYNAISSFMAVTFLTMSGFAQGNIANSVIATGTKNLIADLSSWLTGIAIAVTALVCVYLFIRRAMSDEQDKKQWDNRLKITAVSGIGAITATALIGVIAGYFK
ncbi:MAG: hypothetical protein UFB05_11585 [[Eubacterium] siraeum]|nr:hypothetical protein [[Eubacterium] siraeum]